MKVAALVSGGKDSIYALRKASEQHSVEFVICVQAEPDSKFLHSENLELVRLQAEAMDIPLVWKEGSGEGTEPLEEAVEEVSDSVEGVVSGAIASEYQRKKVEKICSRFGLRSLTPIWGIDELELMEDLIDSGFEIIITKVAAQGLDESWLGRRIDSETVEDLESLEKRYGIHVAGEGGEFETLVLDCPLFDRRIDLKETDTVWESRTKTGYLRIFSAQLEEKQFM